ncbi:hypothetical protein RJ55_07977 [Drechmeria coniospora]|nr:hypothetical protein RJ55_07977 [Drechmeria coniospora]
MAKDALRNLINNIPDWQRRLNDLSGQIDRRQAELAALGALPKNPATSTSLRNKGSSESLRPKDDGPRHMDVDDADEHKQRHEAAVAAPPSHPTPPTQTLPSFPPLPPSPESADRLSLHRKARDAVLAAHSRAMAQARKTKQRPSSVVSAEGAPATSRMRSMIIVYYDSYVQGFFDELVRFISSSRNLMRRTRMAAKVAQIKRMAELEMPDDQASGDEDDDALPSLRYMSTRRRAPITVNTSSTFGNLDEGRAPDVYEALDQSLEYVQSTCEHGAHRFLRDASCEDELGKIRAQVAVVLATAMEEMDRIEREEPALAQESADVGNARALRPISIRKEVPSGNKGEPDPPKPTVKPMGPSASTEPEHDNTAAAEPPPLEVDSDDGGDDSLEAMLPRLQYRTRDVWGFSN